MTSSTIPEQTGAEPVKRAEQRAATSPWSRRSCPICARTRGGSGSRSR